MLGVLNTGVKSRPRGTVRHACSTPPTHTSLHPHYWSNSDTPHPVLWGAEQRVGQVATAVDCGDPRGVRRCRWIPANHQVQAQSGLDNQRHSQTTVQVPGPDVVHLQGGGEGGIRVT